MNTGVDTIRGGAIYAVLSIRAYVDPVPPRGLTPRPMDFAGKKRRPVLPGHDTAPREDAGRRVITLDAPFAADLDAVEPFDLDFTQTPPRAALGYPVGPEKRELSLDEALALREQEVLFWIMQQLLRYRFRDEAGRPNIAQFAAPRRIAADRLARKVRIMGKTDPRGPLVPLGVLRADR